MGQLDLYVGIHKGQRDKFFRIAVKAGTIDYADQASLDRLYGELSAFREHMRLHSSLEEKYIHPLLADRVPGGARKLEEDHRKIHQRFDDLVAYFDAIRSEPGDLDKRRELVLEFYRAWNRFASFYLVHINKEEENVQPSLWKLCSPEELTTTFRTIMANQTPEELKYNLEIMLPAMNLYERAEIINAARPGVPAEMFQAVLKLAEKVLKPDEWAALKPKIGIT